MSSEDKIREKIFNSEFNQKKCGELLLKITALLSENKCNPIERRYIFSVMMSMETNMTVLSLIENDKLHK